MDQKIGGTSRRTVRINRPGASGPHLLGGRIPESYTRFLGPLGVVVDLYSIATALVEDVQNGTIRNTREAVIDALLAHIGGDAGRIAGATVGSAILPGIGTIAGAIIGSIGGGAVGSTIASAVTEWIETYTEEVECHQCKREFRMQNRNGHNKPTCGRCVGENFLFPKPTDRRSDAEKFLWPQK